LVEKANFTIRFTCGLASRALPLRTSYSITTAFSHVLAFDFENPVRLELVFRRAYVAWCLAALMSHKVCSGRFHIRTANILNCLIAGVPVTKSWDLRGTSEVRAFATEAATFFMRQWATHTLIHALSSRPLARIKRGAGIVGQFSAASGVARERIGFSTCGVRKVKHVLFVFNLGTKVGTDLSC
jgi:hypothetical protein